MKISNSCLIKAFGYFLTMLSFGYIAHIIWKSSAAIQRIFWTNHFCYIILLSGLFYCLLLVSLGFAWHFILRQFDSKANFQTSFIIYAQSQIAKYIPGNFLHYASRQILGQQAGFSHPILILATIYESILLLLAAYLITIVGLFFSNLNLPYSNILFLLGFSVLLGLLFSIPFIQNSQFLRKYVISMPFTSFQSWGQLLITPFSIYSIFFIIVGFLIFSISAFTFESSWSFSKLAIFCCYYAGSWILGFIMPGSPGGLGVREAILTSGLTPYIGEFPAVSLAIGFRLITIIGDLILFAMGEIYKKCRGKG